MNVMRRKSTLFSMLLLGTLFVVSGYSQSILSLQYPFGIPLQAGTGPSLSMGGAGIAVSNDYLGMAENPANLGAVKGAVFSAHGYLDLLNVKDGSKETNHIAFTPHIFSLSIPLKKWGTFGLSLTQTANANTKFNLDGELSTPDATTKVSQGLINTGSSNIWQFGWGYSIKNYGKIGIAYQRMYYNPVLTKYKLTEGTDLDDLEETTELTYTAHGFSGGIQIPVKQFTFGLSGQYIFENDAKVTVSKESKDTESSVKTSDSYTLRPAPIIGFGAAYQISPEWLCAADLEATIWSKYISQSESFDNAVSFSAGAQYIPAPNLLTPKYYEIIRYRAGVRYNQLPVSTAQEYGISLGLGLPLRQGSGVFDVFLEYGQRWDTRYDGNKEEFLKIQFGINAGRKWYQSSDTNY